jgi:hypothetical protein
MTFGEPDLFDCTVYAEDQTRSRAEFRAWLESLLGQSVDVLQAHERDAEKARGFPHGFHYFRYRIEAGPKAMVERLLRVLWENGVPAVASCDYEDELPEAGGYKSRNIPWPR